MKNITNISHKTTLLKIMMVFYKSINICLQIYEYEIVRPDNCNKMYLSD